MCAQENQLFRTVYTFSDSWRCVAHYWLHLWTFAPSQVRAACGSSCGYELNDKCQTICVSAESAEILCRNSKHTGCGEAGWTCCAELRTVWGIHMSNAASIARRPPQAHCDLQYWAVAENIGLGEEQNTIKLRVYPSKNKSQSPDQSILIHRLQLMTQPLI